MKPVITVKRPEHPVALVAALAFFLVACFLVSTILSASSRVELTVGTQTTDYWQLFYSSAVENPIYNAAQSSKSVKIPPGAKQSIVIKLKNTPVKWLRIDTGSGPGTVRLYSLHIVRQLAAASYFSAREIYENFRPGHTGVSMSMGNGFVEVVSTTKDPYLVATGRIAHFRNLGGFVVPIFLLSFFLYHVFTGILPSQIRDFFLVNRFLPPGTGNAVIEPLDGLRAMAALMVIADHTWPRFIGVGASGVLIFYTLSGFLLARPFVLLPEKVLEPGFWFRYGKRRLQRILPMYYFYLLIVYVMSLKLGIAILHAFFLKGDGHLWAIPQEMLFYLVFPAIAVAGAVCLKGKPGWMAMALGTLLLLCNTFLDNTIFALNGMNNQPLPFYLGVFLSGSCAAYVYFGWYGRNMNNGRKKGLSSWAWEMLAYGLLLFFLLFSNGYLLKNTMVFSEQFYGTYGIAAAMLLFALLAADKSAVSRFLCLPLLRSFGVVSYSIYLLHPLVLEVILALNRFFFSLDLEGAVLFVLTTLLSFIIALVTYRLIESPFMTFNPR